MSTITYSRSTSASTTTSSSRSPTTASTGSTTQTTTITPTGKQPPSTTPSTTVTQTTASASTTTTSSKCPTTTQPTNTTTQTATTTITPTIRQSPTTTHSTTTTPSTTVIPTTTSTTTRPTNTESTTGPNLSPQEELSLLRQQIVEKDAVISTQTDTINQLKNQLLAANRSLNNWKQKCEELGAEVPLDKNWAKSIKWLQSNLLIKESTEWTENDIRISDMLQMKPSDFQKSMNDISSLAYFKYSLVKKSLNIKDIRSLFLEFYEREPTTPELHSLARAVRVGEFLIKATVVFNQSDISLVNFAEMLRGNTIPLSGIDEFQTFPSWVILNCSPSTFENYFSQESFSVPGMATHIANILQDKKKSETPNGPSTQRDTPNKRKSRSASEEASSSKKKKTTKK